MTTKEIAVVDPDAPARVSPVRRSAQVAGRGAKATGVLTAAGSAIVVAQWARWVWQGERATHVHAAQERSRAVKRDLRAAKRVRADVATMQGLERQAAQTADVYGNLSRALRKSRLVRFFLCSLVPAVVAYFGTPVLAHRMGVPPSLMYAGLAVLGVAVVVVTGLLVADRTPAETDEAPLVTVTADVEIDPEDPFPLADARNRTEAEECIRRALIAVRVDLRKVEEPGRHRWGWQVPILLRSGEPSDITGNLRKLETLLGLAPGQLHVQPDPDYGPRVVLRCVLRDPFEDMDPLPVAAPNSLSIADTLTLAMRMDGQPLGLDLCGAHTIVIARTRAGKSVWSRALAERLLACADTVVVCIDKSGAGGLDCYGDSIAMKARTDEEAFELLSLLVALATVRPVIRASLGMDDETWEQSPRYPAIVVVIDEFPRLTKTCKALALELQQIGAKARISLVVESQKGTKPFLGAAMADAFANRIMLACEHDDVVAVLGPGMLADGWRPDRLRPAIGKKPFDAGIFYALGGENDAPIPAKVRRIPPAEARQIGADRAPSRPQIDRESLTAARALLATGQALVSAVSSAAVLIADMLQVMGEADRMESAEMVAGLRRLDPDEYGELTQDNLTERLRSLGIAKRAKWRADERWARGYTREALEAA